VNNHLGDVEEGIISVDRYSAYKAFIRMKDGRILIAYCWTHMRRDFLKLAISFPHLKAVAFVWVELIGELYHLNNIRVSRIKDPEGFLEADARLRAAVLKMEQRFKHELEQQRLDADYRKVLESLKNHWEGLTVFVDHRWVPMDNNEAERILRNSVVGRKNYYGSGAIWSGHFAAMMFGIFQTLLLWDINPRIWLSEYFEDCAKRGGRPPPDISRYMPWSMSRRRKNRLSFPCKRKR
jgi:transposase